MQMEVGNEQGSRIEEWREWSNVVWERGSAGAFVIVMAAADLKAYEIESADKPLHSKGFHTHIVPSTHYSTFHCSAGFSVYGGLGLPVGMAGLVRDFIST